MVPSRRIARAKKLFAGRRALAGVGLSCVVFFTIGVLVRYSVLQPVDLKVTTEIQEANAPLFRNAMFGLTFIGEPTVVPIVGTAVAIYLWIVDLPRAARLVMLSLTTIPISILMKMFWDIARPDAKMVNVVVETAGTSFPSGHAMGATALYGALAALTWVHILQRELRIPATIALMILPVAIDVSRVYLGAHWFSDVLGGSAFGLLVLIPLVGWYLSEIPADVAQQASADPAQLPKLTQTPHFELSQPQ